jgi:hypothetical protein
MAEGFRNCDRIYMINRIDRRNVGNFLKTFFMLNKVEQT